MNHENRLDAERVASLTYREILGLLTGAINIVNRHDREDVAVRAAADSIDGYRTGRFQGEPIEGGKASPAFKAYARGVAAKKQMDYCRAHSGRKGRMITLLGKPPRNGDGEETCADGRDRLARLHGAYRFRPCRREDARVLLRLAFGVLGMVKGSLPEKVFLLCYREPSLSNRDVAERLGCSHTAVAKIFRRFREKVSGRGCQLLRELRIG